MNEQLIKFIELCLADGVISDKERKVIFRKARSLGVDQDECEVLIESYTQKVGKKPQQNNDAVSKPKRKFTPKTVNKIKPAALDQETKLLDEVRKLKETMQKKETDYEIILGDIKTKTKEINDIKRDIDFKNYKALYGAKRIDCLNKYFDYVGKLVSEKYGEAHIQCPEDEKQKLAQSGIKKIYQFIIKDSSWNKVADTRRKKVVGNIVLLLLACFIFLIFTVSGYVFWILTAIIIILFIQCGHWSNKTSFDKEKLKPILKKALKEFKGTFKDLKHQETIISKYEKLNKYDLTLPKKSVYLKYKVSETITLLKLKQSYGY